MKIGILAHFSKQKLTKNDIFESYYLVQVESYYLVQVGCVLKKRQLGPDNNFQIFSAHFFKKRAETPIFIVLFDNQCFIKKQTWTR